MYLLCKYCSRARRVLVLTDQATTTFSKRYVAPLSNLATVPSLQSPMSSARPLAQVWRSPVLWYPPQCQTETLTSLGKVPHFVAQDSVLSALSAKLTQGEGNARANRPHACLLQSKTDRVFQTTCLKRMALLGVWSLRTMKV